METYFELLGRTVESATPKKKQPVKGKPKTNGDESLFKTSSGDRIASEMKKKSGGVLSKAISALNSHLNRDKPPTEAIQKKIRAAIAILKAEQKAEKAKEQ